MLVKDKLETWFDLFWKYGEWACTHEAEKEWNLHKYQNGITQRSSDYESKYMALLQRVFPEHWSSFRSFEATRVIYNTACKFGFFEEFKNLLGMHCDFLNVELNTDTTLSVLKDLFTMVANNMSSGMNPLELKFVFIELAMLAVP